MGLAARLNAAAPPPGGAPPAPAAQQSYGAPPPQHQQSTGYGQPLPQPPQQQQYGAPQGAPPPYGGPQGGQSSYAPPAGPPPPLQPGRPQSSQYGAPPGPPPPIGHGQPQQGQYGQQQGQYGQQQGQYGQPQQQAYGAPSGPPPPAVGGRPGAASDYGTILSLLQHTVRDQGIHAFYQQPGKLEAVAQRVAQNGALARVAADWSMPLEIAMDLAKLALFDVILYCDDSGSMQFEEGGSRIDDLKLVLERCAFAASLFDDDGLQVRFMNSKVEGNGIRSQQDAMNLVSQVRFSGLTPLGTALDQKVLQPLILGPARAGRLDKPVLVIAITDGVPGGEDRNTIVRVLVNASRSLAQTPYGSDALSVQIAQIGNDLKARAFLEELDSHPEIGGLIDCTSNFENEEDNFMKTTGQTLTPELWLMKLLMGAVDTSYDLKDE